ncbi:MAG: hypothetical protein GY716_05365 [bacterium]|nr:hypothetical protein [bacterium]
MLRVLAGWVWLCAWGVLLWVVVSPWRELGGLVSERLRWVEWLVLCVGFLGGFTLGGLGRDLCASGSGWTHALILRCWVIPVAGCAAVAMVVLSWLGSTDEIGVALTALLAYWAGLDVGIAALPLMQGRDYRLRAPIDEDSAPPESERDLARPPWDVW